MLRLLYTKQPTLKVVLQDLEGHLNAGKKYWSELFPEAIADGRVEFEPHDFFTENPRKAPNTIYWFRFVTRESLHLFMVFRALHVHDTVPADDWHDKWAELASMILLLATSPCM